MSQILACPRASRSRSVLNMTTLPAVLLLPSLAKRMLLESQQSPFRAINGFSCLYCSGQASLEGKSSRFVCFGNDGNSSCFKRLTRFVKFSKLNLCVIFHEANNCDALFSTALMLKSGFRRTYSRHIRSNSSAIIL
jgi:hypothetical protein